MATELSKYWAFLPLLAAALLISRWLDLGRFAARIHRFLCRRGFSRNQSLASEVVRLEIARILCGLIVAHRMLYTILYLPADAMAAEHLASWSMFVAAMLFAAGVLTPAAGFFLLVLAHPVDDVLRTVTLGTDVLQMLLLVLVFAPVGHTLSLDGTWGERVPVWRGALRALRSLFGPPTLARISVLRFLALISFGILCLYSLVHHFTESAWTEGYANALVLTSSYLSQHFALFRELFAAYPAVGLRISEATLYGMIAWELVLIPAVLLGSFTRNVAVAWGVLFFLVSTFVLQLGWLSYYEYVLWAVLFWQSAWLNAAGLATIELIYDDRCNLCDRTVRFLSRTDLFGVASFRPLSHNPELLKTHGISAGDALQDLYGVDRRGRVLQGYDLYTELARRILLLLPAWPVLVIGRWLRIGPWIYRWVAARRIRLFGVCERAAPLPAGVHSTVAANTASASSLSRLPMLTAVMVTYAVLLAAFLPGMGMTKVPDDLGALYHIDRLAHRWLGRAHALVGLDEINVFNAADLRMSERFFTVEERSTEGSVRILPFNGPLGERLAWHYSDRVYITNSLAFRRQRARDQHGCYQESHLRSIREIVAWARETSGPNAAEYVIRYYFQPLPEVQQLKRYQFQMPEIQPVCEVIFDGATGEVVDIARRPQ